MGEIEPSAEPVELLVESLRRVVPEWLAGCVTRTAQAALGACPDDLAEQARQMADRCAPAVTADLEALLRTDVDEQRTNPLALLRRASRHPTELLQSAAVPPVRRDAFAVERFPDDVYDLGPASWAEVHPDLHDPGIVWGAWKAATVLHRRRTEGMR